MNTIIILVLMSTFLVVVFLIGISLKTEIAERCVTLLIANVNTLLKAQAHLVKQVDVLQRMMVLHAAYVAINEAVPAAPVEPAGMEADRADGKQNHGSER